MIYTHNFVVSEFGAGGEMDLLEIKLTDETNGFGTLSPTEAILKVLDRAHVNPHDKFFAEHLCATVREALFENFQRPWDVRYEARLWQNKGLAGLGAVWAS